MRALEQMTLHLGLVAGAFMAVAGVAIAEPVSVEGFVGLDGSKQPQDLGVNAELGPRVAVNVGLPLWPEQGVGVQLGTAVNYAEYAVGVVEEIEGSEDRWQSFTTLGLFCQGEGPWRGGVAYDYLVVDGFDRYELGQVRGRLGYQLSVDDGIGVWFTVPAADDTARFVDTEVSLETLAQASLYWQRSWPLGTVTRVWLGAAESHREVIFVLPEESDEDSGSSLVYGAELLVPLNDHWAVFGQANFIRPPDSGTVDAFLGLSYVPGGNMANWQRHPSRPPLAVANNTTLAVDLAR
jgi:hypothetical protein